MTTDAAPRTASIHPERGAAKGAILAAARTVFAESGFDGASLRDIAQRAGVTQPLVSYHFASKDALWRATVTELFDALTAASLARREGLRGVADDVMAGLLLRHFVEFCAGHPELHRIIGHESRAGSERLDWLVETHVRPLFDAASALSEQLAGRTLDERERVHLYYLLVGAGPTVFVHAAECTRLTGVDPFEPRFVDEHAELLVEIFVNLIRRPR